MVAVLCQEEVQRQADMATDRLSPSSISTARCPRASMKRIRSTSRSSLSSYPSAAIGEPKQGTKSKKFECLYEIWKSVLCDTTGIVREITETAGLKLILGKSLGILSGWVSESAEGHEGYSGSRLGWKFAFCICVVYIVR